MSFSEFTKEDYDLIRRSYEALMPKVRKRCRDKEEVAVVEKAFEFANAAHRNIRRRSGVPYIIHPIEVAGIVVEEIGLGYKSITAALLHDVVEDTNNTVDDIRNLFGDKVAQLVDGLTKIKSVLSRNESLQAENFKRIMLTLGDDARVVLIKLADRLHNCRTIEYMPEHKRDKILSETMYLFIPLAHRLGLYSIKSEMENIWLKWKEPEEFRNISNLIDENIRGRAGEMEQFVKPIEEALSAKGYRFELKKRVKTPYSIWYKMKTKHVPFEEIYDIYAVRIIYEPSVEGDVNAERMDAYAILTILTSIYPQLPGRFRNWVLHPKSNGYEALHCTLMSRGGVWIEVQIRSRRMDDIAEKGIAAHWMYKQHGYSSENDTEMDRWLERIQEILGSQDVNSLELLDIIHSDLVSTDIVVFTPKGEQKSIVNGSTALDFAYLIHSRIGNNAIAAKINRKLVPLSQTLKAGDQVEIITAGNAHPKVEWLQFLVTRNARSRVIDYFREQFDHYEQYGRQVFEERLAAMGLKPDRKIIRRFQERFQLSDVHELYFRIGLGMVSPEEFCRVVASCKAIDEGRISRVLTSKGDDGTRRYVMAECCHPIPGDPVVGFLRDDGTVVVHKKSCPEAEQFASKHGNTMVRTEWLLRDDEYPIRVSVKGLDRIGLLNEITQCISLRMEINMRKLVLGCQDGIVEGYIEMFVTDKSMLNQMIDELRKIPGIRDVVRTDIM